MKKARLIALSALISGALMLTGCQNQPTKEEQAGLVGAIAGGLLGSQVGDGKGRMAAIMAGTIIGHHMGSSVGRTMDEVDRMKANQALESQPVNKTSTWTNPDSGNKYAVTPTRTFFEKSAETQEIQPCREYTTEAWIGGQKEMVYGTACRQDDGSWKIVSTK
jgi:surface antigen